MSLLTMMAAFGPALAALDATLDAALFGRFLARLADLKVALRTEARASFAEFVADVARLDSWKGVTAASSVRSLEPSRRGVVRGCAVMRAARSAEETACGKVEECGVKRTNPPGWVASPHH